MLPYNGSIVEQYTSSFFIDNNYDINARNLSKMAKKGIRMALKAFSEFGNHIDEVLKIILYMFAPEAIILGGSISKAYPYFENSMKLVLLSFAHQKQIENLKIDTSYLSSSPILGAAALCA